MKETQFKYYFTIILTFLIVQLNAQTSEMKWNRNQIPRNDEVNPEIKKLFEKANQSEKDILVFAKKSNDSLISVFVYNNTKDSIVIERQDRSLFLIQEAKNKNGIWKPIEYWQWSNCGNSFKGKKIASNEIIQTKSVTNSGYFKTKIRFKFYNSDKVYYSNSIEARIKPNQFKFPTELYNTSRYKLLKKRYGGDELFKKIIFLEEGFSEEWSEKRDKWWNWVMKKRAELHNEQKNKQKK